MLILLPPSEGKAPATRGRPLDLARLVAPELTQVRTRVLSALADVSASPTGLRTLGLSPGLADQLDHNVRLVTAPSARADRIYRGVLFEALGFDSLPAVARRRAGSRVLITSSVFGVLRPHDRIPAYRLSGSVNLPGLGPIARVWRDVLDPTLTALAGRRLLVDLRSSTYAAFWRPGSSSALRLASVRVWHEVDGRRTIVSHFNKATKGRIVRALLTDGADPRSPHELAEVLTGLGWTVEVATARTTGDQAGTVLDVIVTTL
ncbi:MAG: YaaA family protein [Nocardioides sp.]